MFASIKYVLPGTYILYLVFTHGILVQLRYFSFLSHIFRYEPSQADVTTFKALGKAPASSHPHALRWYNHINSFGSETSKFPSASSAAPVADSKPVPADDDDDDVDLFGSDDEEVVLLHNCRCSYVFIIFFYW